MNRINNKNIKRISGLVIVKDAENTIERCLKSLYEFCDDIVIVDTGCTDRTIQLIEDNIQDYKNTINIVKFDWINDYSAARNFGLIHTKYDWVFFVDADEEVDKEGIETIKQVQLENFHNVQGIWIENGTSQFFGPRMELFNKNMVDKNGNFVNPCFKGAVHEYLDISQMDPESFGYMTININHYQAPSEIPERAKKYYQISKKALLEGRLTNVHDWYMHGTVAHMANQEEEAKECMWIAISLYKIMGAHLTSDIINCYDWLAMYYKNLGDVDKALALINEACNIEERYDLYYNVGLIFLNQGKFSESLKALERAEELAKEQIDPTHKYFISKILDTYFIPVCKAIVYKNLEEYNKMREVLIPLMESSDLRSQEVEDLYNEAMLLMSSKS